MAASVLTSLIFMFFLPCFSNSCLPTLPCARSIQIKPPTLPCDHSIQIKPPFYLSPDFPKCRQCNLKIGCSDGHKPVFFLWSSLSLTLKRISYDKNTITVQDTYLSKFLEESLCGNLYFNFSSPINNWNQRIYDLLNNSLSFVRCDPPNQIQLPPKIFGKDYNLSYSLIGEDDKIPPNCSRHKSGPDNFPYFEYTFSFKDDSGQLSLLSASYSRDFVAQPGCCANWKEVSYREDGKASSPVKRKDEVIYLSLRTRIVIGCVVGFASVLSFGCLLLFFYKRKKLILISSSSKLLVQREVSDQYFHDSVMVGSEYTQIFSYEELREATKGFSKSKKLGDGGFGIVYKGILKDGRTVAVKRLYRNNFKSTEQFINEVKILSNLHHMNLVTLYGSTARSSKELLLVYEFVANGTVADHLHGPRSSENVLTWSLRLSIAIETANALAYLHEGEPPIIHRDVKTNNILLDGGFHVKVGDFGLSRLFPLNVTHVSTAPQGTPGYVDPVYHQCYHLTDKSDVYSFGVVLMELISSKQAIDLSRRKDEINLANMALKKIQRCQLDELVDPALGFSSNWEVRHMISLVAELAFRCLQPNREMRPSIKEVLETLRVIEKNNYNGDKMVNENMIKEKTYLLKGETNFSPDTMTDGWNRNSTTPNTSG